MILLDSNILIAFHRYEFDDEAKGASILSRAELEFGVQSASDPHLAAERTRRLNTLDETYEWVPFDVKCATAYGTIAAGAPSRGAKIRTKDALIAAQAYRHGAKLMTANRKDFEPFERYIEIVDPTPRTD